MSTNYVQQRLTDLATAIQTAATAIGDLSAQLAGLDAADPQRVTVQATLDNTTALHEELTAEQGVLNDAEPDELSDHAGELGLLSWLTQPAADPAARILAAAGADPVRRALNRDPAVTPAAAAAILNQQPGPRTSPTILRAQAGDDAIDELIAVARAQRLHTPPVDRPYLYRDIAVLLPLRLETVFTETGGQWTMRLRIVPDEASVLRDDPTPTRTEIACLEGMWTSALRPLLPLDPGELAAGPAGWLRADTSLPAWEVFCRQVGGARAAWLAGSYPPSTPPQRDASDAVVIDAPEAIDHHAPPNRVSGFPEHIEIWCAFGTDAPVQLQTAAPAIDQGALTFDVIGATTDEDGERTDQSDKWWVSWTAAQEVGLGLEIVLPDGHAPADITALYAIGIGEEEPSAHFTALIDSGELARLPLGVATNTVDGAPAADLGNDARAWLVTAAARLDQRVNPVSFDGDVAAALVGPDAVLPPIPTTEGLRNVDTTLVAALGPVLWGHNFRDIWGLGDEADRLCEWVWQYLRPQGPLPPIRVDDQPYGLLPVSDMGQWEVPEDEPHAQCEPRMLDLLRTVRGRAADATRRAGNAVGADAERLLDLIGRDGVSTSYVYRLFLGAQLWEALYSASGAASAADFQATLEALVKDYFPLIAGGPPARFYLTFGDAPTLDIPLVVPTVWPEDFYKHNGDFRALDEHGNPILKESVWDSVARLVEDIAGNHPAGLPDIWKVDPDSLLIRLLLQSRLLADAWVYRTDQGDPNPMLDPIAVNEATKPVLWSSAQGFDPDTPHEHQAGRNQEALIDGLHRIIDYLKKGPDSVAQIDRALRATIDTATFRVDPWLTGMASRRLGDIGTQPGARYRLGVFGWVEGPILGTAGPTDAGLVHAPSQAQALTAAVLRDRHVTEQQENPAEADRWSMQLESSRVRLANEIAEEVQIGSHPFEVLGRLVERVIGTRDAVADLRSLYPLHRGQDQAGRVCHGLEALSGLLDIELAPVALDDAQKARLQGLRDQLSGSNKPAQLAHIRDSLDCYGDLLVAEAVHQVVTGRADIAGAALDAAAGLAPPPHLAFPDTALAGDGLGSAVISLLPADDVPPAPATVSSAALADPAVATAVAELTGAATEWIWRTPPEHAPAATTTLADLGLAPIDTVLLSSEALSELVRHRLGQSADPDPDRSDGLRRHQLARDLVRSLGIQPAFLSDVAPTSIDEATAAAVAATDTSILDELYRRYAALRGAAQKLVDALQQAIESGDPTVLADALWQALKWGISPTVAPDQQPAVTAALLDHTAPADPTLLPTLAQQALDSLTGRVKAAPTLPPPPPEPGRSARADEGIGRAIAELAAPEGQVAVLSRIDAADLVAVAGLADAPDTGLDEEWLTVVAAVRPHLARLEALQLEASAQHRPALTTWSNAPGDRWRVQALAELRYARTHPGHHDVNPHAALPRFVAAYGTSAAMDPGAATLAVGLIDSWTETVPAPRQTTTAAFGFNGPASRAPQAILIAVPPKLPDFGAELSTGDLVAILADTRQLVHGRAVRFDQLSDRHEGDPSPLPLLPTAIPTTMFQGQGWTGMRLDTSTSV